MFLIVLKQGRKPQNSQFWILPVSTFKLRETQFRRLEDYKIISLPEKQYRKSTTEKRGISIKHLNKASLGRARKEIHPPCPKGELKAPRKKEKEFTPPLLPPPRGGNQKPRGKRHWKFCAVKCISGLQKSTRRKL